MAKQAVWSRIINWRFPGANTPLPSSGPQGIPPRPKGHQPGPSGTVAEKINPNQENGSFGEKVKLMNCDYQIAFSNFVIAANVAAVQVSISVENGDGQKSNTLQTKLQTLWDQSVASMMPSIGFGRVAFEKSYSYDVAGPVTFIEKLEPMEFEDSRLRLTKEHQFDGFDVRVNRNPEEWLPVAAENAWWLALNATAKNPHGVSKYQGAVEQAWKNKNESMINRNMYVRRFAIRGGIARGPETYVDPQTNQIIDSATKMGEAAENMYTGGQMFLSNKPHSDPYMAQKGEYEWTYVEADVTALDPKPILDVIDKDDVAILRAFGIPEKAAIEGDGAGSYAQLTEQILTLFAVVDSIVGQWVASFQKYVVEPSRCLNYGEGPGPKFTIHAIKLTNRPDSFVIQLLTALAVNPQFAALILNGGIDLRNVLELVGLPVSSKFEEVAQQVAARFQAVAPATGIVPGQPGAASSGAEFANSSRRQLTNNLKATQDALEAFAAGEKSEAFTQTVLESYGWSPERAKALIDDARDGKIDDPEVGIAMFNAVGGEFIGFCGGSGGPPGPCPEGVKPSKLRGSKTGFGKSKIISVKPDHEFTKNSAIKGHLFSGSHQEIGKFNDHSYLTPDQHIAESYGKHVSAAHVNVKNVFKPQSIQDIHEASGIAPLEENRFVFEEMDRHKVRDALKDKGYDAVDFQDIAPNSAGDKTHRAVLVFNGNNVKKAQAKSKKFVKIGDRISSVNRKIGLNNSIEMEELLSGQQLAFKNFLADLVKKKSRPN